MSRAALANDRRPFWPRAGPAAAFVPDLGDDRPCENCGSNLRGLPFNSTCPECGSTSGIRADAEPIAWNDEPSLANYFRTALMVLTGARDLAAQVWTRDMLWMRPARRFRGVNVALATIALSPAIVAAQASFIGLERALWCAPLDVLCALWWFLTSTAQPAQFLKDKGSPIPSRRAEVLSAYLSATLILSPLHLLLLAVSTKFTDLDPLAVALSLHVPLLLLQMLLVAVAESALLWQLVELPRGGAFMMCLSVGVFRCIFAAVYLIALPAIFASMVTPR